MTKRRDEKGATEGDDASALTSALKEAGASVEPGPKSGFVVRGTDGFAVPVLHPISDWAEEYVRLICSAGSVSAKRTDQVVKLVTSKK